MNRLPSRSLSPPGIRQLQLMLLKVCLILGVEIHVNVEFTGLAEPPKEQAHDGKRARRCLPLATALPRPSPRKRCLGKSSGSSRERYLQRSHAGRSIDRGCWQALLWGRTFPRGPQLSRRGILRPTRALRPQVAGGEPSCNPPTTLSRVFILTWWLEPMDARTR